VNLDTEKFVVMISNFIAFLHRTRGLYVLDL